MQLNSSLELNTSILKRPWRELEFVGFDTETTGKYPLTSEICELAGVKWRDGKIIDKFSTLIKPSKEMGSEVIAIHGISNEMVSDAPTIDQKIAQFRDFIGGSGSSPSLGPILIAHHAPFDLGFVSIEFEKKGLVLPNLPVICSSLLSRRLFPESKNHRLQTLIDFFGFERGSAHRAYDDAVACLGVGLKCFEKVGVESTLESVTTIQGGPLWWERFSMKALENDSRYKALMVGSQEQWVMNMVYSSGSSPGESRRIHPMGLVRSLDGDFLVAYCEKDQKSKRYLLERIVSVERAR
jgi:DNA polymerase-3 subunit epsilon